MNESKTVMMKMTGIDWKKSTATVTYQFEGMETPIKMLRVPIKGILMHRCQLQHDGKTNVKYYNHEYTCDNNDRRYNNNPLRLTFFQKNGKLNGCRISHVTDRCYTSKITDLHGRTLDTGLWMEHTPKFFRRVELIQVK